MVGCLKHAVGHPSVSVLGEKRGVIMQFATSDDILYAKYTVYRIHSKPNTLYAEYTVYEIHCMSNTLFVEYTVCRIHCMPNTLYAEYTVGGIIFRDNILPYKLLRQSKLVQITTYNLKMKN